MWLKKSIFILFAIAVIAACTKKKVPANDSLLGLDYYPTDQGKYVVYNVDSTVYTDLPQDTLYFKYQIKEKIADSFTDAEGKPAIRLERYIRMYDKNKPYDSIPWAIKEVWMVNADKKSIQVSERDVRYTKLIFPVQEKATWKGNARNTVGDWDYTYEYIDKTETINGKKHEKVLAVTQFSLPTLISNQVYTEKYAKGVGLVYREMTDVSANVVNSKPVMDRIVFGLVYKQTYVTHGTE